jgi:hypothetical protein
LDEAQRVAPEARFEFPTAVVSLWRHRDERAPDPQQCLGRKICGGEVEVDEEVVA